MYKEIKKDIANEEIKEETENECSGSDKEECSCGADNNEETNTNCGAESNDKSGSEKAENVENEEAESYAEIDEPAPEEQECESERYMRLMADFQNYKRRSEKERSDIYSFANEKIVSELLAVADNFERALASVDKNESFVKGMEMIFNQLIGVMTKAGVEEIKALGEDFDPNFHNAVMAEESSEYESGKVTEVLQKGYILNGKVIRPSMVKVAN